MPTTTAEFSNGYALFIGVGNYLHADKLPATVNDATVLYKLFTNPLRAGYPESQVKLLVNEQATRQGILDGLQWLIECTRNKRDVTAVVYFSGHGGVIAESAYVLAPFEFKLADWMECSISKEEFAGKIDQLNQHTKKLLVILDCCHASGMTAKGPLENSFFSSVEVLLSRLKHGAGKVLVASCKANQKSYIVDGAPYSIFTNSLVDALDVSADDGKGYATVLRTLPFVSENTKRLSGEKQTPVFDMIGVEDFAICRINKQLASKEPFKNTHDYTGWHSDTTVLPKNAVELTSNFPSKPAFFLGRQKLLAEIHERLTDESGRQNIWLLNGIGGMGKTTLMREYLYSPACRSSFDRIAFVAVDKNLESAFIRAAAQALGQAQEIESFHSTEMKLEYLVGAMRKMPGINLFIVDNINERDFEDLKKIRKWFVRTGWKFLITTRTIPDGFDFITVYELDMEDAALLFAFHFFSGSPGLSSVEGREEKLRKLIKDEGIEVELHHLLSHILRHTLLTELLAKAAMKKRLPLTKLLSILENEDYKNPELNRTISIGQHPDFTFREQLSTTTLHVYLLSLFETEYLVERTGESGKDQENEAKVTMLRFFSVLPPSDIPLGDLKELWRVTKDRETLFEDRLDELKQIGWIQGGENIVNAAKFYQNIAFRMHKLIQEVVYEKLAPDIENCGPLVETITEALTHPGEFDHIYDTYAKSVIDNLHLLEKGFYGRP